MTSPLAPAGWYADPEGFAGQRYFDGFQWTPHRAAPAGGAGSGGYGPAPWKGAQIGRPPDGPGSLANPGLRLGARLLDGLVFLPVIGVVVTLAVVLVAPHAGPIFPSTTNTDTVTPTPGIVWIYLAALGGVLVSAMLFVAYEATATARYGRTLGKAWLHIRPVGVDGGGLGAGVCVARALLYWFAGLLGVIGLLDPLWCLWDANTQCLHDKAVDTVVVNDR